MAIDPSDIQLTDRVAVVTGGGAGIGRGIAAGLAAFCASVAIWERDAESCAAAAESIGALGIVTDVRESGQVDAALCRRRFGTCRPGGVVRHQSGELETARKLGERCLDESKPKTLLALADVYGLLARHDEQLKLLDRAIVLHAPRAHVEKGTFLRDMRGDAEGAEREFWAAKAADEPAIIDRL